MSAPSRTSAPLKLADGLSLPLAVVTEKLAWLGRTGSGKTYGAMKAAELMLEAGAQVGAIDPVGVWRALRVPAEGGRSYDVVVFGGLYGDLPLEPTAAAGELIADLVVERGLSFVLDVSQFIPSEQQRFVRSFADRFFHRKKASASAVHLFMEECQEFIPENPSGLEAATLGAMQRLWKLGRNFGIGGSLISQRPQEIAKKALNMSGTLFAFQMTGPQERKAIKAWVADHGVATDIEGVLQRLTTGQPHVESPTFLGVSKTVRILPRKTADLSSTPEVGASTAARRPLTPIDVAQLRTALATTIEKAKADDPKVLRASLAEQDRRIKELEAAASGSAPAVQAPALTEEMQRRIVDLHQSLKAFNEGVTRAFTSEELHDLVGKVWDGLQEGIDVLAEGYRARLAPLVKTLESPEVQALFRALAEASAAPRPVAARPVRSQVIIDDVHTHRAPRATTPTAGLSGPQQRILDALAWGDGLGFETMDRRYLALLADASPTSSSYANNLGALRTKGLLDYPGGGRVRITAEGRTCALRFDPPASSADLQARIYEKLPGPQVAILRALLSVYPKPLDRVDLAALTGASPGSSSYANNLGALRTLGLVDYPSRGQVAATEHLFL